MEPHEEKLGTQFKNIQRNLGDIAAEVHEIDKENHRNARVLIGALVVVVLGIAGVAAKGLGWF